MKRIWVLVLLISLGLNVGLGLRLMKGDSRGRQRPHTRTWSESHRFEGRWAHRDSAARRKMFSRRLERMSDTLGLDADQQEAFAKIHAETGHLLMTRRGIIAEKRTLLHDLVAREDVDRDQFRAAIAELGQQQAVLDSLVAETVLQEMAVLEPAQRGRYLELLPLERGERGGPGGRGGRRPRDQ